MAGLAVRMDLKDGFFMIGIMPIINQGSNGVNGYSMLANSLKPSSLMNPSPIDSTNSSRHGPCLQPVQSSLSDKTKIKDLPVYSAKPSGIIK